jgi:hypothetical protein
MRRCGTPSMSKARPGSRLYSGFKPWRRCRIRRAVLGRDRRSDPDGIPGYSVEPNQARTRAPWRTEPVQQAISMTGRAARLDVGILFNFDEDYGYAGAGEQKRLHPWNTWSYDLPSWASLFSYDRKIPVDENRKPILASGENDRAFPPAVMRAAAESIAGPVELKVFDGASQQLMLFHTAEFSTALQDFVLAHI